MMMMTSPLRFPLLLFVFLLFHSILIIQAKESEQKPDESFFLLCSGGDTEALQAIFESNPDWVHAATDSGESCLHLTGITGQTETTRLLLNKGANPNIRSTFDQGLRMHPLSWNVYGNHHDNAKLLLEHGADVNADFDLLMGDVKEVVTVLDIVHKIQGDSSDFEEIEALILKHGAKTMAELQEGTDKEKEL